MDDVTDIKEQVSIYEVLRNYGLPFIGGGQPEQIHCPFHHPDTNRSARIYPENNSVYCFVCDKTWDVIEFVKDKDEVSFGRACAIVKQRFDVHVQMPDYEARLLAARHKEPEDADEFADTVERLFVKYANDLTNGELYVILTAYNTCLVEKEDMVQVGKPSVEALKAWYNQSKTMLRMEFGNG